MSFLFAASLYAASDVAVVPMGLACDGFGMFPCTPASQAGFLAQARSKAPVVMFELRYRDAGGVERTARQAVINDSPGDLIFAAFRVGMYRTNFAPGTEAISLRVTELSASEETKIEAKR